MRNIIASMAVMALVGPAFAANYSYTGAGADPNDWTLVDNWGGSAIPDAGDNALFVNAGKGMTISSVVPEHAQMHVGRGVANGVTISEGGVLVNSGQTAVGINSLGQGTLIIDGGSLTTLRLRCATTTGALAGSLIQMTGGSIDINATVATDPRGDLWIGEVASATFEISGGDLTVENEVALMSGSFKVIGDDATMEIGDAFNFGTAAASATVRFELAPERGVSTIFADSFVLAGAGDRSLFIDGSGAENGAVHITLMSLSGGVFTASDLAALQAILGVSDNINDGTLSLENGGKDLVFSGTVGFAASRKLYFIK